MIQQKKKAEQELKALKKELEARSKRELRERITLLEKKTENISAAALLEFLRLFSQYEEVIAQENDIQDEEADEDEEEDEDELADEEQQPLADEVQADEEQADEENVRINNRNLQVVVEIPEEEAGVPANENHGIIGHIMNLFRFWIG
uniref:Uncharacterized protein n=1 Tax=Acrobeloides nanus TaxID=290746 RepID=A0A914E885_9BILA